MKKFLVLCILLSLSMPVFSSNNQLPPLKPIEVIQQKVDTSFVKNDADTKFIQKEDFSNDKKLSTLTPINHERTINYPKIDEIEAVIFGKKFTNQDITTRIARIENSMFNENFTNNSLSERVENIISNFYGENKSFTQANIPTILPKNALNKLEQKILGQNFENESENQRLARLEEKILGASQSGGILQRYEKISKALKQTNSFANTFQPRRRGLAGILDKLEQGITTGTMTGFTPSLDDFDTYGCGNNYNDYNNYTTPQYNMYKGIQTNSGYFDQIQSYGTGSGVTILD